MKEEKNEMNLKHRKQVSVYVYSIILNKVIPETDSRQYKFWFHLMLKWGAWEFLLGLY